MGHYMTLYYIWIQTVNDLANQSCASEASLRVNTLQMKMELYPNTISVLRAKTTSILVFQVLNTQRIEI